MGIFKRPIYSVNDCSTEKATIAIYDIPTAVTPTLQHPGFDPLTGSPYKRPSTDPANQGLGVRDRPDLTPVDVRCKATWQVDEEQVQTNVGNNPRSVLVLTLYAWDLNQRGLMVDGQPKIKANDRLLKLSRWADDVETLPEWADGSTPVRADFTRNGRRGLFCYKVEHQYTGSKIINAYFESRATEL